MQTEVIFDDEHIEIFNFYSAASYNSGVHVFDSPLLCSSENSLKKVALSRANSKP